MEFHRIEPSVHFIPVVLILFLYWIFLYGGLPSILYSLNTALLFQVGFLSRSISHLILILSFFSLSLPSAWHWLLHVHKLSAISRFTPILVRLSSRLLNTARVRCISPPIPVFSCVCFEKLLWIIDWQKEEIDAVCLHSEPSHFLHGSLCHSLSVRVPQDHALSPAIATVAPEYHGPYLKLKNVLMNTRSHTATGKYFAVCRFGGSQCIYPNTLPSTDTRY